MARLLIYDAYENKVYTYANLNENDPMPYSTLTTLRLREFRVYRKLALCSNYYCGGTGNYYWTL